MREKSLTLYSALKKRLEVSKWAKQFESVGEDVICFNYNYVINELKEGIAREMVYSLSPVW